MESSRAVESAVTLHTERLYGIAYNILGSHHDAEDVLQEVWLQFSNSDRAQIRDVAAWLNTVTINRSLTRRERLACRSWIEQREPPQTESAASDSEKESLNGQVGELIASIRPRHREVLEARYYEGRSVREIAERSDSSTSAIQGRLQRALEHVRQRAPRSWRNLIGAFLLPWRRKGEDTRRSLTITAYAGTGVVLVGALAWLESEAPAHGDLIEPTNVVTLAKTDRGPSQPISRSPLEAKTHGTETVLPESTAPVSARNFRIRGSVVKLVRRRPHRDFRVLWAPLEDPEDGRVVFSWDGGASGEFEVNVPEGWLWAEQDQSWPGRRHLVDREANDLELALTARRTLHTQVVDSLGRPVPNTTLRVTSRRHASDILTVRDGGRPHELSFETDEAGWVTVERPLKHHSLISAWIDGQVIAFTMLQKGENTLVLQAPASLVLQGLHPQTGPVAGARVNLRIAGAGISWSAVTDSQGVLELDAPPNVPLTVLIQDPGSGLSASKQIVLRSTTKPQRFDLPLSDHRIEGRIEADGRPAAGWLVRAVNSDDSSGTSSVRTDREGRFELRNDHSGPCTLALHEPSNDLSARALFEGISSGSEVTLVAPRAARKARISGWVEFPETGQELECWVELNGPGLARSLVVRVDDSGEFETRDLYPGNYEMSLMSSLHGRLEMTPVELKADHDEVVSYKLPVLGALEVRVHAEVGPDDLIRYQLRKDGYERFEWHDGEGPRYASSNTWFDKTTSTLTIPDLPPGEYQARFGGPFRFIQRSLTIEPGALTSISTEACSTGYLHMTVLGSSDLPVDDEIHVEWERGEGWQELPCDPSPSYVDPLIVAENMVRVCTREVRFRAETSSGWHASGSIHPDPDTMNSLKLQLTPPQH